LKKIGILGGMSWQSTAFYYRHINRMLNERMGGLHSAECVLYSVDFQRVVDFQKAGDWSGLAGYLSTPVSSLESVGARMVIMASNTVHLVYEEIVKQVSIPVVHIVDAVGERLYLDSIRKVGILGTRYTLQHELYNHRLRANYRAESILPNKDQSEKLDEMIFGDLSRGQVTRQVASDVSIIADDLMKQGAEALILACTELSMLQLDEFPVYDSARIHCQKAVIEALEGKSP